jgi:hypothetical protein
LALALFLGACWAAAMRGAPQIAIAEMNAAAITRPRPDGWRGLAASTGVSVASLELLVQVMPIAPRLCRAVFSLSTPLSVDVQRRATAFASFAARPKAAHGTRFDRFTTRVAFTNTARGAADSAKSRRVHGIFTIAISANPQRARDSNHEEHEEHKVKMQQSNHGPGRNCASALEQDLVRFPSLPLTGFSALRLTFVFVVSFVVRSLGILDR